MILFVGFQLKEQVLPLRCFFKSQNTVRHWIRKRGRGRERVKFCSILVQESDLDKQRI